MSIDRENAAKRISVIDIRSVSCANTIPPFFPSSLSQYRVHITIEHFFPLRVTRVYSTLQRKKPLFRFEEKKRRIVRAPRYPIYFSVRSLSLSRPVESNANVSTLTNILHVRRLGLSARRGVRGERMEGCKGKGSVGRARSNASKQVS